jgi:uncharacterized membrane-anchored protein YhcB (DUF1043 family)
MVIFSLLTIALVTGVLIGAIILSVVGSNRSNERTIRNLEQRIERLDRATMSPTTRDTIDRRRSAQIEQARRLHNTLR